MEVGRVLVVFAGDVGVEGGLLRGVAAEDQDEIGHGKAVGDLALIVSGVGGRMGVALEGDELGLVDAAHDADGGRGCWRLRDGWKDEGTGEYAQGDVEGE